MNSWPQIMWLANGRPRTPVPAGLTHTYNFFLFQYLWLSLSATYLGSNPGCTATGYMIVARRSNLAVSEFIHLYKRIPIVHNS